MSAGGSFGFWVLRDLLGWDGGLFGVGVGVDGGCVRAWRGLGWGGKGGGMCGEWGVGSVECGVHSEMGKKKGVGLAASV